MLKSWQRQVRDMEVGVGGRACASARACMRASARALMTVYVCSLYYSVTSTSGVGIIYNTILWVGIIYNQLTACRLSSLHSVREAVTVSYTCFLLLSFLQTIMSSYVEQTKPAAQRMNALFHAFILCQLWTLYLEEMANSTTPSSEPHNTTVCILLDFWCKLVPSILQVTVQSKVVNAY